MTPVELRAVLLERLPVDPRWTAWVEGVVERVGTVEDPRIARIAAFCEDMFESADPEVWPYAHQLRAVLGEVQPTPPHRIDRDALAAFLAPMLRAGWHAEDVAREALSLALVRPVEGVVLTPEEREKLAYLVKHGAYSSTLDIEVIEWFEEHGAALAARLEVSS